MSRTMPCKLLLPLLAALLLNGCGWWGKEPDPTRGWSARQLYQAGKDSLDEGDYDAALDYYGKLESRYPFGVLAEQAQLETAYAAVNWMDDGIGSRTVMMTVALPLRGGVPISVAVTVR